RQGRSESAPYVATQRVPKSGNPQGRKDFGPFLHRKTRKESPRAEYNPRGGRNKDTNRLQSRLRYLCTRVLCRPAGSCKILGLLRTAEPMKSEKERKSVER